MGKNEIEKINNLRTNAHFKGLEQVDLLKSYYHNGYKYNLSNKLKKVAYYREYFKDSSFFIMSDGYDLCADLEIVYRSPHNSNGILEFELNGIKVGTAKCGNHWSKEIISIPANAVMEGLNTFIIHWPLGYEPSAARETRLPENLKGLEALHAKMYVVIGEIHSLQLLYKTPERKEQILLSERGAITANALS